MNREETATTIPLPTNDCGRRLCLLPKVEGRGGISRMASD